MTISYSINGRGLSPHIRGNRWISSRSRSGDWVYPRTYGGTASAPRWAEASAGLSPHIRGNRYAVDDQGKWQGSIPAHTGEPQATAPCIVQFWVYPRTYGGTSMSAISSAAFRGLSPHIRGNHAQRSESLISEGSIPAHTGEPCVRLSLDIANRVYPRTYGGTRRHVIANRIDKGLSPHIRGNQSPVDIGDGQDGSIPAHTGEP